MIAFLQLPYRPALATANAVEQTSELQVLPPLPAKHALQRRRTVLAYLRLIAFRSPRELGPRVVGITLSLILAGQLALVLWLYWSEGHS